MGVIITLQDKNLFKQNNKITKTPVYPMHLHELKIINNYNYVGVIQ